MILYVFIYTNMFNYIIKRKKNRIKFAGYAFQNSVANSDFARYQNLKNMLRIFYCPVGNRDMECNELFLLSPS